MNDMQHFCWWIDKSIQVFRVLFLNNNNWKSPPPTTNSVRYELKYVIVILMKIIYVIWYRQDKHKYTHTQTGCRTHIESNFPLEFIYFIEFFKSNVHATFHATTINTWWAMGKNTTRSLAHM